jgi:hypothetical protein
MDRRIILRQDGACAPLSGNDDANHQSAARRTKIPAAKCFDSTTKIQMPLTSLARRQ